MIDQQRAQTIRRAPHDTENPFAQISRELLQNKKLSHEARGLMGYLLSKSGDWEVRISDLQCIGTGRDRAYKILDELMAKGYIKEAKRYRNEDGFWAWTPYEVHETPLPSEQITYKPKPKKAKKGKSPFTESQYTETPYTEIAHTENQDSKKEERTKKEKEETTLQPAIADRADTASASHNGGDVALNAEQIPSQAENVLPAVKAMSPATAPSPSLKPKSPTAQNTTAPIPHSAPPLSPADAPVSVDDVERFSSKLEQDKGKKAAKRSEAQLANDALVEALRVAWFTAREKEPVALGRTDYSNYLKVARVLVEGGATTDLFFTYVQYWFKASVAGGWTLTINSLVNNGRIADFKSWYASRAKKAISRDSTSTQVSTTQTGSKRAYDRRSDPTYAHLYETPTEVKQAK
jgi:hypothetical protein